VSWISPIARALMGARVGDTVVCDLPAGPTRLKVLSIEYR
jgi:transcription elongation GreA/GreB family factor